MNRIKTVKMWILRRMLSISTVNKVSNTKVFKRAETGRELLWVIEEWKAADLGHFLRSEKSELIKLLISGKIDEKRPQGRKKLS